MTKLPPATDGLCKGRCLDLSQARSEYGLHSYAMPSKQGQSDRLMGE